MVEDDKRLAAALQRGLEAEGFAVDVANNGTDGHWMATSFDHDLLILDIMLPGMNGLRLCADLRARQIATPILMLTAKDGELDEAEALDNGADDFLSKPFSYTVLLARVRALLRRASSPTTTVLRCGDLELDPATHTCRRHGLAVALTVKELAVLEYLMRHAGEVVPKSEILEHVWDFAYDGDVNVVEVHVSNLRAKIDKPFRRRSIQTVRGAGYRLVPDGR